MPSVSDNEANVVVSSEIDSGLDMIASFGHNDIAREVADRADGVTIGGWEASVIGPEHPVVGYCAVAPRNVCRGKNRVNVNRSILGEGRDMK